MTIKPLALAASCVALLGTAAAGCGDDDGGDGVADSGVADATWPDAARTDAAPPVAVLISEVVPYPVQDWNDSAGGGTAFDGTPGTGLVNSVDEWVELINAGSVPVDLGAWSLEVVDTVPATTALGSLETIAFSDGSSLNALQPGGFAVIGNPDGIMETDSYLRLLDGDGDVVDDVEIGGNTGMRDPEQDGVGDGAPDAAGNGFARGAFEEAVARPDGAADTDDDQADFVKLRATPLAPNVFTPPVETVAPTVTGSSTGAAVPVSELLWVGFDEPIDPASATPTTVTMKIATSPVEVDALTFTDGDRTVVVNTVGRLPFDVDVEVTVHGGAGGVADLAGNPLAADHVFSVHTEAAPANPAPVRINELVVTPVQDWNDTAGGDGAPFSATPGTGQVTSSDEWVEIVNASGATVDMTSYSLIVFDGFNVFTAARAASVLGESSVVVYGAGSGVDSVAPGDRVVVGNPAGSLFFDCYVELRDGGGALIDAVEIGGNFASQDRGGDGVDNGAPEAGADGRSTGVADEAIARVPDGADTGDDVADFVAASATLGAAND